MKPLMEIGNHRETEENFETLNKKEFEAMKRVLRNLTNPETVCSAKIMQTNLSDDADTEGDIEINQISFAQGVTLLPQIERKLVTVKIDGLNRKEVKYVKEMCYTTYMRCSQNNVNRTQNDYYMTFDFCYLDEENSKSYVMSFADTPIFASGDGDADLWLVFDLADCFIASERYNAHELEYYAMVAEEEGNVVETIQDKIERGYN
jgi:hypothetical protein